MEKRRDESKAHHAILALEVTGGFMKGAKLEFRDGLNCIFGPRGTGKTTVLELIAYVLGLHSSSTRLRSGLLENNLGSGRARVRIRTKDDVRYVAERPWGDVTQVSDDKGEPKDITFDRDLIFNAEVYSQNEIEEVATSPLLQLELLDKLVGDEVRELEVQIRKVLRSLEQNAGDLRGLDHDLALFDESEAEVPALEEKLKGLQNAGGPDAKILNEAHAAKGLREKERKTLEALEANLRKAKVEFESLAGALSRRLAQPFDRDVLNGPNKKIFGTVSSGLADLSRVIEKSALKIAEESDRAGQDLAEQAKALVERHLKQESDYRETLDRSKEEVGRAAERTEIQKRYLAVTMARKEMDLRKKERRARADERNELLESLWSLRDQRFEARKKMADELNKKLRGVRVSVNQAGNHEGYKKLLSDALVGSGMKYTVVVDRVLVSNTTPEDLATLVNRNNEAKLAERTGIDVEKARKVIDILRGSEKLYQIETVDLEDHPRIELEDGKEWKESTRLSTGQRCTTILPILLLGSRRPLLIDQPEDNIDNRFIYESVVKTLLEEKENRQLIFITHNPNIPVLGNAERVFLMDSDGKQGKVVRFGTVDEMKADIETVLEGGADAFRLRKEKYGR